LLTNRRDIGDFAHEQFLGQRLDERWIAGDQRQAGMELLPLFVGTLGIDGNQRRQKSRGHLRIGIEFLHDLGDLVRFRTDQAADKAFDAGRFLLLRFFGQQRASILIHAIPSPEAGRGDQSQQHDRHRQPG
jgi:hypothetical protein